MLAKRVIPCLDVDRGRVVKGVQFKDLVEAGDPVVMAAQYEAQGADELVFLDISASVDDRDTILDVARRTAEQVFIPLTVAGGIRSVADMRRLLRSGADKIGINTAAVGRPSLIAEGADHFGAQCIVVSIDAKRGGPDGPDGPDGNGWEVYTHGGRKATGIQAVEWAEAVATLGAGEILLTSIDRDGTQNGYDIELLTAVNQVVNVPVIASGGAGKVEHFAEAIIEGKADAVLAASLFHFGTLSVVDVKRHLHDQRIEVRL